MSLLVRTIHLLSWKRLGQRRLRQHIVGCVRPAVMPWHGNLVVSECRKPLFECCNGRSYVKSIKRLPFFLEVCIILPKDGATVQRCPLLRYAPALFDALCCEGKVQLIIALPNHLHCPTCALHRQSLAHCIWWQVRSWPRSAQLSSLGSAVRSIENRWLAILKGLSLFA